MDPITRKLASDRREALGISVDIENGATCIEGVFLLFKLLLPTKELTDFTNTAFGSTQRAGERPITEAEAAINILLSAPLLERREKLLRRIWFVRTEQSVIIHQEAREGVVRGSAFLLPSGELSTPTGLVPMWKPADTGKGSQKALNLTRQATHNIASSLGNINALRKEIPATLFFFNWFVVLHELEQLTNGAYDAELHKYDLGEAVFTSVEKTLTDWLKHSCIDLDPKLAKACITVSREVTQGTVVKFAEGYKVDSAGWISNSEEAEEV